MNGPIGCGSLRVLPVFLLPMVTTPSASTSPLVNGTCRATFGPLAIPNLNFTILTQWAVLKGPAIYLSDAREFAIK